MQQILEMLLAEGFDAEDVLGLLGGMIIAIVRAAPPDRRQGYTDALINQIVAQGRLQ